MELTHAFTVPVDVATTWAAFEDISSVAGCFPGACESTTVRRLMDGLSRR